MSRSFFLDLEASDSEEEGEESSLSEVSSVERSRQLSERVPLRKPDEPCALDAVISKWETIGENARDHTENRSGNHMRCNCSFLIMGIYFLCVSPCFPHPYLPDVCHTTFTLSFLLYPICAGAPQPVFS